MSLSLFCHSGQVGPHDTSVTFCFESLRYQPRNSLGGQKSVNIYREAFVAGLGTRLTGRAGSMINSLTLGADEMIPRQLGMLAKDAHPLHLTWTAGCQRGAIESRKEVRLL